MKNKKTDILQKIGLTSDQSLIYKTLLEYGPLSPSELVRKSGLHRPAVYRVLPELERLELVSVMPRGKFKAYVAESPNRLEKMFENIEDEFNSEIFRMHESYDSKGKKPVITYTEGDGAIKALFSDVVEELNPGDTYYRYSTGLTAARMNLVPRDYRSKRDRKQLERLVITDAKSLVGARKRLGKSVRSVPDDFRLFDDNVTQLIFGNKVAIIDYNSKTVMVIENEMVAAFQKKLFLLTWKMLDR